MLLYLGHELNRVVVHLNTELQLPGTLYLTLSNSLKTLTLLKEKLKSIKTYVRDISFQKECSVHYNKNPEFSHF